MIRSVYERVRDSLFALPAALILLLGGAAWAARGIDGLLPPETPWLLRTTVDSTRAILQTVATATITVAGIVFSMTAVVVQLATSQLSPRVTQGILRDRFQQITVGVSVGTFVYALLVLSRVRGTEELPFYRFDFSATMAVLLGVVSMVLIVFFIDRTMRNMRIDTIIRRLGDTVNAAIARLPERDPNAEADAPLPDVKAGTTVEVHRTGWVVYIDFDEILRAIPSDTLVRIDLRVGDFITRREVAARTWPEVDEATENHISGAVIVSRSRSVSTDPAYGIRQMVDIALRALSPSLNDPTTASDVVRHLGGPVQNVLLRALPGRVVTDEGGRRIYLPRVLTHSDYVHEAFGEIRLSAGDQPHVLYALIETLASLRDVVEAAGHVGRLRALEAEADLTLETVQKSPLPDADKGRLLDFARRLALPEEGDQ